ncbi:DUF7289 family protein [Halorarius litoreus]|uniref:DUF7289 family protein n=1 Tax=Halorarius litoreus TaxID=2962676 RepID=UPI0020CF8C78|nr:hypothetical protein [Halorarius litoreus]
MTSGRERGQSDLIGVVLLLSLILMGSTAVVTLGATAISDTQDNSEIAAAEQSMTLFDSQAAQVALGDAAVQSLSFGTNEGTMDVRPNSGEISIIQLDCDNNGVNDDGNNVAGGADSDPLTTDDDAYILPPTTLGSVVYDGGSNELAYQGGGVWRKSDNGGSVMVSPPEFHYRGATLTLPIVLTRGSGAVSGPATARIRQTTEPTDVFPKAVEFPDRCWETGDPESFNNPVNDGTVIVRVESEYTDGWVDYFEARTDGDITQPSSNVAIVELKSLEQVGPFSMPGEGGSVTISGTEGHATKDFSITLRSPADDSARFANLQWSMYVDEGAKRMEIHARADGGDKDCSDGTTDYVVDLTVYYTPDRGDTYQGWHSDGVYDMVCEDFDDDGVEELQATLSFVDDEDSDTTFVDDENLNLGSGTDPKLEYVDKSGMDDLVHFNIEGGDVAPSTYMMDGGAGHNDWEPKSYEVNDGDTETVDRVLIHYFGEFEGEFDLTVDDKGSDTVNEGDSEGFVETGGGDRYVTFIHVTKNEIEVELD